MNLYKVTTETKTFNCVSDAIKNVIIEYENAETVELIEKNIPIV